MGLEDVRRDDGRYLDWGNVGGIKYGHRPLARGGTPVDGTRGVPSINVLLNLGFRFARLALGEWCELGSDEGWNTCEHHDEKKRLVAECVSELATGPEGRD